MKVLPYGDHFSPDKRFRIRRIFSECDQLLIVIVDRIRICLLRRKINFRIVRIYGKPRHTRPEARIHGVIPLVRSPRVIPRELPERVKRPLLRHAVRKRDLVGIQRRNIIHLFDRREFFILHPDLLPLIDPGKTLQEEIPCRERLLAVLALVSVRNIAGHAAGLVMILDDVGNEPDLPDLLLCVEDAVTVLVRGDVCIFMPAFSRLTEDSRRKVEHR